mgnify:CR=1 FL=1|jgi:hypothetical protein
MLCNSIRMRFAALGLTLMLSAPSHAVDIYQDPAAFLGEVFAGEVPAPQRLWLTPEISSGVRKILGYDLGVLRVRFWTAAGRTAWILDEIGKDQPITTGLVVNDNAIEQVRVLIYRESRGSEVRHPVFTEQFRGARIGDELSDFVLDRKIDGISGATLSVHALTRLGRLALFLDSHVRS